MTFIPRGLDGIDDGVDVMDNVENDRDEGVDGSVEGASPDDAEILESESEAVVAVDSGSERSEGELQGSSEARNDNGLANVRLA